MLSQCYVKKKNQHGIIQEAKSHHFLHPEADFNAEVEQLVSIRQNFFMVAISTKTQFEHKCNS